MPVNGSEKVISFAALSDWIKGEASLSLAVASCRSSCGSYKKVIVKINDETNATVIANTYP